MRILCMRQSNLARAPVRLQSNKSKSLPACRSGCLVPVQICPKIHAIDLEEFRHDIFFEATKWAFPPQLPRANRRLSECSRGGTPRKEYVNEKTAAYCRLCSFDGHIGCRSTSVRSHWAATTSPRSHSCFAASGLGMAPRLQSLGRPCLCMDARIVRCPSLCACPLGPGPLASRPPRLLLG